jgi:hypothetical protein
MLCGTDIINREKSVDHFRQTGVTPQLSTIYLLFRSLNFVFGGSVVTSTIPADLLELKARFETWRTNRKYAREPIPDELWTAAADLSRRYPPSLVGRVLKLDPSKLKKLLIKRSPRTSVRKKPQAAFFQLPTETALPEVRSQLPQGPISCRLQIERPDGSRLTLTLPPLDLVSIHRLCADFLRS